MLAARRPCITDFSAAVAMPDGAISFDPPGGRRQMEILRQYGPVRARGLPCTGIYTLMAAVNTIRHRRYQPQLHTHFTDTALLWRNTQRIWVVFLQCV